MPKFQSKKFFSKTHCKKTKIKENFGSKREKILSSKGIPIRLSVAENLQIRGEWDVIFKVLNERNCQPRILYQQSCPSEMKAK